MAATLDALEEKSYTDSHHKTQLVVFGIESEEYGIQIEKVHEISDLVPIVRMPKAPYFVEGVVNLRNHIIPIVDLHKRFNLKERDDTQSTSIVIIEETEGNRVGFIVDEVKEVVALDTDQIDERPTLLNENIGSDFMAGVGKIEERLIILLDIDNILKMTSETIE